MFNSALLLLFVGDILNSIVSKCFYLMTASAVSIKKLWVYLMSEQMTERPLFGEESSPPFVHFLTDEL